MASDLYDLRVDKSREGIMVSSGISYFSYGSIVYFMSMIVNRKVTLVYFIII